MHSSSVSPFSSVARPSTARRDSVSQSGFFALMNLSQTATASSPDTRMTAIPPLPCGVDTAAIVDENIDIPGIIEFSNLRPVDDTIVYVPYYMPTSQPKWQWTDQQFIDEAFGYIRRINPAITGSDLIDATVGRLRYAQPVCEPNFYEKLPEVQTPISGLQIADTCFYYPEDRGVSESIRFGRSMAEAVV